jgi:serine/threonine-protein kinase
MVDLRARLQAALSERYTIERELGRGGMATVFLARDLKHERAVAIKVLHPELASAIGVDRFLREIKLAARLQHPNILPLHDSGEVNGLLFYAMPFVDGESLRDRLAREQHLGLDESLKIAREAADALEYAHRHDVVHRDIKPENILLSAGQAVVADFGIARAIDSSAADKLTQTGIVVGTPAYMSPEQAAGEQRLDGRSDIYSLGCVVYEMLAGHPPFFGATAREVLARHTLDPVPSLRTARPTVPASVERSILIALAKSPADRFARAAEFAAALAARPSDSSVRRGDRRAWPIAATIAVAIAGALLWSRSTTRPPLDPDLVAVAPFTVFNEQYDLWREGLVDLLSSGLDGAGPLRTVSPTVVVRGWSGHADATSAAALGRRTGARFAVYGRVVPAGQDSVRLTASLLDVATGQARAEVEVRDLGERLDRVADSLVVGLLRELGRARPTRAQFASLGTTSLPALKAFLQAEQFYRLTLSDSALAYVNRAITLDRQFAVAWRRLSTVSRWLGSDSLADVYAQRAASLNHGLAPRDSILIFGDSLFRALERPVGRVERPVRIRLISTLEAASRRYSTDPEVWYSLADAGLHFPVLGRTTSDNLLATFQRAISLDSTFGPPYIHAAEIALGLGRTDEAQRYLATHLRLKPVSTDAAGRGVQLAAQLVDAGGAGSDFEARADTLPTDMLLNAFSVIARWTDSAETTVRLARILFKREGSSSPYFFALPGVLAYRGHLREAYTMGGAKRAATFALFGGVPPESLETLYGRTLRRRLEFNAYEGLTPALYLLPRWSADRDTAALRLLAQRHDSVARNDTMVEARLWGQYGTRAAAAYLALARGDTALALQRFTALPDSVCLCVADRILTSQLLAARGLHQDASRALELGQPQVWYSPLAGLWYLERARVAEQLGQRENAIDFYQFVRNVWRHADPELQPFVAEAHAALTRLGREPR